MSRDAFWCLFDLAIWYLAVFGISINVRKGKFSSALLALLLALPALIAFTVHFIRMLP